MYIIHMYHYSKASNMSNALQTVLECGQGLSIGPKNIAVAMTHVTTVFTRTIFSSDSSLSPEACCTWVGGNNHTPCPCRCGFRLDAEQVHFTHAEPVDLAPDTECCLRDT